MNAKGLSLIELVIAIAVFAIIGLAASALMVQGLQVRRESQLDAQAQAFAASVLEQYKSHWAAEANYKTGTQPALPPTPGIYSLMNIQTSCLDSEGSVLEPCGVPPLRRIRVTLTDQEAVVRAELVTEIGHPRP